MVVDDDEMLRAHLRRALQEDGHVVIAEASNGRDAIDLAVHFRPDVVVMDVAMGTIDGLTATRAIIDRVPTVRVLLFTVPRG